MSRHGPHRIIHDHKHQSLDDFDHKADCKDGAGVLSDDGSETLVDSSKGSNFGSKRSSKGKFGPQKVPKDDNYIPKSILVTDWIKEQRPRRRFRWWILVLLLILLAVILIPVLVVRFQSGGIASGSANSTATATVFISLGITTTATATTTASGTTFITTQTLVSTNAAISPSTSSFGSASPQSSPTPVIPNEGFHAKSYQNGDLQIIYADGKGNIKSVQRILGSWSNPATIATDAAIGTTVSVSIIYYHDAEDDDIDASCMDYVDWNIYYVDKSSILQELHMTINFDSYDDDYCSNTDASELSALSGYSWTVGSLGSFNYKVGPSLYQSACTSIQNLTYSSYTGSVNYPPANEATVYIYYDSYGGNITKLGAFSYGNSWQVTRDLPQLVTANDRAVECNTRNDGTESVWVATQRGTIQQWWTDTNVNLTSTDQSTTWNSGLTYNGSIHVNTSIHSLSIPDLTTVYFQAANNSIMQLTFTKSASFASAAAVSVSEVAVGLPGTRFETSGGENPSDSFFYLYFQNGTTLVQMYMQRDSASGLVFAGGSATASTMGTITIPPITFYAGMERLGVAWLWLMLCFGGVGYFLL